MRRPASSRIAVTVCSLCAALAALAQTPAAQPDRNPDLAPARALIDARQFSQAESALRAYLNAHAASAEARYLLAYTLFREDKPADSLSEYTHAAQLRTPTAEDLRSVALDYVLLHDYPDADKWLTQASAWAPQDAEIWYSLGRVRSTENRFQEALACFEKSLALEPRSVKAENNLGVALEGLNRPGEAMAAYRQAIAWQQGSDHPSEQPLVNLGRLLLERGQLDAARPLLEQARAIAPRDAKVRSALGRLYERAGDLPKAQAELEASVAILPDVAALHFQLGQVYRREKLDARAKSEFARAAALDAAHSAPERPLD